MLIHGLVEEWAARTPGAPALIEPGRAATYEALDRRSNQYARLFLRSGIERGDRVIVALESSVEMATAYLGAMKAGAIAVPLPGGPRNDRLAHAVKNCAPRVTLIDAAASRNPALAAAASGSSTVFVAGTTLHAALESCPDRRPEVAIADTDLAAIIYTSGSTGEPRGVMLTHRNFAANAESIVSYLQLTAADRVMSVLPFNYVYGLSLLHTHLMVGGSVVIDNRFTFPNVVIDAMRDHAVTGFAGVPSTFALLLHRSNLEAMRQPALRYVTQAGGAMPPARILEWLERGPQVPFFVMYGATEAAARLSYLPPSRLGDKLGSIGRAIPGVEIVVTTESGTRAGTNEVGELVARGENIARGYWDDDEETARKFGPLGYRTGDLGYADEEGFLFLVGRQGDMIKVGAHRVGAREIEDVLNRHPDVYEAAVVAAAHDLLGEVPVAFVALRKTLADAENTLRAHCSAHLAPHKVPARVTVLDELPKLRGSGKLDRRALGEPVAPGAEGRR